MMSDNLRSLVGHVQEVGKGKLEKRKSNPKGNNQQIKMLASKKIVAKKSK